ncbi:MAG: phospho-N-acetylmuramoyl-pentapeptide-transferase [Bacilli bacterium]|jgi:phospho-N-acetylmuramoyl-pentapeptide-transferase|nr:phospho-N-acetylmuramoyl-pentapeptide-transferase [Bacilli bacterium]
MLTLTKSLFALMIGFILSTVFGYFLIPILKKIKAGQRINVYVENHQKKSGTPTMGGLIFIIPTIVTILILLFTKKIEFSVNLLIVLFVFISYSMIGFLDDYISIKKKRNEGLTQTQKLLLQFVVALVFYLLYSLYTDSKSVLEITALGIKWNLGWFYGVFILFLLVGSSNAVNLTDGLDGLAGGLSAISFLAFGLISWGSYWIQGYQDIGIFCFVLVGSLIGFLVYNTNTAKVFMGDTGSLTLGATLATIAILTSHELSLAVIGGVFVIETLTVIIQVISVKFFHKRVFLMAPIHHHFERLGWKETDIVKLFWIIGLILALLALIYGVWL